MKIGILTLNGFFNYGNRLQNYALQSYLKSLSSNIQVDTIWYTKNNYALNKNIFNFKNIRRYILNRHNFRNEVNKGLVYSDIIREFNIKKFSDKYISTIYDYTIKNDLNDRYDYFIVGSDQIWNPKLVDCKNEFLQFADFDKRIAYSASIGITEIPDNIKSNYEKYVKRMKHISVREKAGASIISQITGKNIPVLLDPTLLLTKEQWNQIIQQPVWDDGKKYILVFFLAKLPDLVKEEIKKIAVEKNLKIIDLMDKSAINTYVSSPDEFLWCIKNASLVYTDSFHCTVFSILFNVPFVSCSRENKRMNMDSRIDTLLELFNLKNRKTDKTQGYIIDNPLEIPNIDIEGVLSIERTKARQYLTKALNLT